MRLTKTVRGGGVPGEYKVIWDGLHKPFIPIMSECLSIELRPDDIVVDIGAYVGSYSLIAAKVARKVVAYEPTPFTFAVLSENCTGLSNVELKRVAVVGDEQETTTFFTSPKTLGVSNSIVRNRVLRDSILVPSISYRRAISEATVVKIDVEGGEYSLPIANEIPRQLRALIVDVHRISGDRNWMDKARKIIEGIEVAGFKPVKRLNLPPPEAYSRGFGLGGSWIRG